MKKPVQFITLSQAPVALQAGPAYRITIARGAQERTYYRTVTEPSIRRLNLCLIRLHRPTATIHPALVLVWWNLNGANS